MMRKLLLVFIFSPANLFLPPYESVPMGKDLYDFFEPVPTARCPEWYIFAKLPYKCPYACERLVTYGPVNRLEAGFLYVGSLRAKQGYYRRAKIGEKYTKIDRQIWKVERVGKELRWVLPNS